MTAKTKKTVRKPRKGGGDSTGTKCTTCEHPDVLEINSQILNGVPFRTIAARFGLVLSSISRHTINHLKKTVAMLVEQNKIEQAINVYDECREQLGFAKQLRAAAYEYLMDTQDPLKLVLLPRADEIDVVYYDFQDKNETGYPKKKTAKLHALLARTKETGYFSVEKINIKHVDMRKYALDAIAAVDAVLDKFARLQGDYTKERANPNDVNEMAEEVAQRLIKSGWDPATARQHATTLYPMISNANN